MFQVGDLIIYSAQGICRVDNICEKDLAGVSKHYYDLHPLNNPTLKISIPVDNQSIVMMNLIERDEAEEIMESFKAPGIPWIEKNNERYQTYAKIVSTGNRKEIAQIANTLMRKKHHAEMLNKKLGNQDLQLLTSIQSILFYEMALALETTYEAIVDELNHFITFEQ